MAGSRTSSPGNIEGRDYFVFDLSGISGTIIAAYLRVSTAPPGFVRYASEDPSERRIDGVHLPRHFVGASA